MATTMLASKNLVEARNHIQVAYDLEPANAAIVSVMAALFFRESDRAQAEQYALRSLELNPGQEGAVGVMVVRYGKEKPEQALAIVERGAANNPESVAFRVLKIQVLEVLGRTAEVVSVHQNLIDGFPGESRYVAAFGGLLYILVSCR
jgi:predicted Zn-dependent protease